jgi:hypothetical protein
MPILTLELIADDPWNAVDHDLPPDADGDFLELALDAVTYCERSQHALFKAARKACILPWWSDDDGCLDVLDEAEKRWLTAFRRCMLIDEQLQKLYLSDEDEDGVRGNVTRAFDFGLRSLKSMGMFAKYKALRWKG